MLNFLEPYQADWLTEFEQLKKALLQVLEEYEIDVQHVGSTAIPNLFANIQTINRVNGTECRSWLHRILKQFFFA